MKAEPAPESVAITALDHEGRGVARIAGKTVFVDGALPGEEVSLQLTVRRRRHDEARVLDVLRPSPDRVNPRCAHFGVCGGCSLQHLDYGRQLEAKGRVVAEQLERLGGISPGRWLAPLFGPAWAYRRRARLGCRYVERKGKVLVGFRERSSPLLADLSGCEVLAAGAGALIAPLAAVIGALGIRRQVPQIELAVGDNATALVLRVLADPSESDLELLGEFERAHRVELYLQRGGLDTVVPLSPVATNLQYELPGLPAGIRFAPTDFIQVNGDMNRRMVALALELLEPGPGERALDLFCGVGNFTLPLAQRVAAVTGIEADAGLVARARENAARNAIGNADFEVGNLAAADPLPTWASHPRDLVLLDPPRAGAREVLPAIAACRPRRVVYVSCHSGTLARDAGILVSQHGFRLVAAGIMDMFPHTAHVETIALFEPAA
ncbi:MAG: 23S rRNA (uracil(1939)-C(5))-methyltransferase RlmD [Gammaproteobacteria bacterium]